jgi:hypothetical protein
MGFLLIGFLDDTEVLQFWASNAKRKKQESKEIDKKGTTMTKITHCHEVSSFMGRDRSKEESEKCRPSNKHSTAINMIIQCSEF